MPVFRLSRRADADLREIGVTTLTAWGARQAADYLRDLEACCQMLADGPAAGRECDKVRAGMRRMERGSHVIFYHATGEGILIVRILHKRMVPDRRFLEDE